MEVRKPYVRCFGSLSLTNEPARTATLESIIYAKDKGIVISFDPNYRSGLWKSQAHAKEMIIEGLKYTDILKISEEEFHLLVGEMGFQEGTEHLVKEYQISLLFVTLGNEGCFFRHGRYFGKVKG